MPSYEPGDTYGRYRLIRSVAEGGMATVWLARLRGEYGFERNVAIKMILPTFAREPSYRDMFLDEARIASRVEHPNVAQILDLGEHDGKLYMVMEWVDGASLFNLLHEAEAQGCAIPIAVLLRIIADACAGLHVAHELRDAHGQKLDVVHRDVSPQNILIGCSGNVKVIDFGVLKARGRLVEETLDGIVKGKLQYVAPERALGVAADCRADIWALGAILYRVLGGRLVYEGEGNLAVVRQLISRNEVPALPRSVPLEVREIVYKALARDPAERYQSAAELQHAIEDLLHRFTAATTATDVAAFLESVLGPSLDERRHQLDDACNEHDDTSAIRLRSKPAPQPLPVSWTDGGEVKPPIRLMSELARESAAPSARSGARRATWLRGSVLVLATLVAVAGVLSAVEAGPKLRAPMTEAGTPNVPAPARVSTAPATPAHNQASLDASARAAPAPIVTPASGAGVVSVSDLPLEVKTEARKSTRKLRGRHAK